MAPLQAWYGPKDAYEINVQHNVLVTHKRKLDDGYISCLRIMIGAWESRGICLIQSVASPAEAPCRSASKALCWQRPTGLGYHGVGPEEAAGWLVQRFGLDCL